VQGDVPDLPADTGAEPGSWEQGGIPYGYAYLLRVAFQGSDKLYIYKAGDTGACIGDWVAVPPNLVSSEGNVALVKESTIRSVIIQGVEVELSTVMRVIPPWEYPLHGIAA